MSDLRIIIAGAGGRMGKMLIRAVTETEGCTVVAALARAGSPALGRDAGVIAGLPALGVPVMDDPLAALLKADALIDFTSPASTVEFSKLTAQARVTHVIGTTGLSEADFEALQRAAYHTTIIQSGNMSLGVNLVGALVKRAAAALGVEFDIEILEMHHKHKVDAPSGTALLLGEAAASGRAVSLKDTSVRVRDGHTGARDVGSIGFQSLRGGSVIGDHHVIFAGDGERIELVHRAEDRSLFAKGAVKAALWGKNQKPGYYNMADVLGLNDA